MTVELTRRRLFRLAGASAAGAAWLGPDLWSAAAAAATGNRSASTPPATLTQTFVSRPDLTPPRIYMRGYGPVSTNRYFLLDAPYTGPGHGGAIILDSRGHLIWFGPNSATQHKLDVNVQSLSGVPVLTWWQGLVVNGHGEGEVVIADSSYRVTHVIRAHNGVRADLHEFVITPQGTALISAYRTHAGVDLSALGGPASGYLLSGVFQEIDIATGNLLFEWDSFDPVNPPVPLIESNMPLQTGQGTQDRPFDYFHINSIDTDVNGDYLVSGRHTWTVYKISKTDGSIVWRINGKSSDFTMGPGSNFFWQHHVRPHGHGQLTVFDNAATALGAQETSSRALLLTVDTTAKQVTLVKAITHPGRLDLATALGSVQLLPEGEVFVDWGDTRRFSQFAADGSLLVDGLMAKNASSYRGFSKEWVGNPMGRPAAAARYRTGGATVYASWNGATRIASWTVFAGSMLGSLTRGVTAPRTGFETAIAATSKGPYFAVEANDATGQVLGRSAAVRIL